MPLKTLILSMIQYDLNPRDMRLLNHDEMLRTFSFQSAEIYYIDNYVTSELNVPISISVLTHGCVYAYDCVKQTISHNLEPPESCECHSVLSSDIQQQMFE
jgi:hypothetical protein